MDSVQRLEKYVNALRRPVAVEEPGWWAVDDTDWDAPPCTPECPCPRCVAADAEEAALAAFEAGPEPREAA